MKSHANKGNGNGFIPNSLKFISSCIKTASSGVRSASASVAASISGDNQDHKDQVRFFNLSDFFVTAILEFSGYCGLNSRSLFGIGVRNTCKFCFAAEKAGERKRDGNENLEALWFSN
jgi:hypothetical protein